MWRVAWAHPSFGNILASCSYDRMVFLWKETSENVWNKIHNYAQHTSSGALCLLTYFCGIAACGPF